MAFILNQSQHWYTLRRFGDVSPDPSTDSGQGHWFNLNSSLPQPEWVGKLYLSMFLRSAEQEGYSIFAVMQIDPNAPLALLRTEADEMAMSIPENATNVPGTYDGGASSPGFGRKDAKDKNSLGLQGFEGLEDEDMELQAALQASLLGVDADVGPGSLSTTYYPPTRPNRQSSEPQPTSSTSRSFSIPLRSSTTATREDGGSGSRTRNQTRYTPTAPLFSEPVDDDSDEEIEEIPSHFANPTHAPQVPQIPHIPPFSHYSHFQQPLPQQQHAEPEDAIEASRRRGAAMMEAFTRQQQAAMQFTHEEEEARIHAGFAPRRRQTRQEQEDEELRRAIEESRALAEQTGSGAGTSGEPIVVDEDEDDEDYVIPTPPRQQQQQQQGRSFEEHRVYDDDDAELQAALKASLETVPEGFRVPSTPPRQPPVTLPGSLNPASSATSSSSASSSSSSGTRTTNLSVGGSVPVIPPLTRSTSDLSETDTEFETETESEVDATPVPEPAKPVNVEEMRRMRLARFGAP